MIGHKLSRIIMYATSSSFRALANSGSRRYLKPITAYNKRICDVHPYFLWVRIHEIKIDFGLAEVVVLHTNKCDFSTCPGAVLLSRVPAVPCVCVYTQCNMTTHFVLCTLLLVKNWRLFRKIGKTVGLKRLQGQNAIQALILLHGLQTKMKAAPRRSIFRLTYTDLTTISMP